MDQHILAFGHAARRMVLVLACLIFGCAVAAAAPLSEIIQTQFGPVRGARTDMFAFRGIAYAAPPVGALRWRATEPPLVWKAVRDATRFGAICPQSAGVLPAGRVARSADAVQSSEDCLTLNVWTAAASSSEKRPVMVWFHGGGFTVSSSADPQTDGSNLARRGVVVVSVNYRLGPLGFLAHPALTKESPHHSSGNYGLLDQITALHWVKANIALFGGDPANVTLFGQSAGSTSAADMMVSPLAAGLFHRVILESPGASFWGAKQWLHDAREGRASAESDGAARVPDIEAFRKLSADEVLARLPSANSIAKGVHYYPIVDGYVLPDDPQVLIGSKLRSKFQIMIGHNADEGMFFASNAPKSLSAYKDYVRAWLPGEPVDAVLQHYPAATDEEAKAAALRLTGDLRIGAPSVLMARKLAPFNAVHVYQFSRVSPYARSNWGGAAHTSEIPYVFGTVGDKALYDDTDRKVSDAMTAAWVRFATTGDPNGPGLSWPLYKAQSYQVIQFGDSIGSASDKDDPMVGYLEQVFRKTETRMTAH